MDTQTGLNMLILANTIILMMMFNSIIRQLDKISIQLAQISVLLAELTDLCKTTKNTIERIEWRS